MPETGEHCYSELKYEHLQPLWTKFVALAANDGNKPWVAELFGLAGFMVGWLCILLDAALPTEANTAAKVQTPWAKNFCGYCHLN